MSIWPVHVPPQTTWSLDYHRIFPSFSLSHTVCFFHPLLAHRKHLAYSQHFLLSFIQFLVIYVYSLFQLFFVSFSLLYSVFCVLSFSLVLLLLLFFFRSSSLLVFKFAFPCRFYPSVIASSRVLLLWACRFAIDNIFLSSSFWFSLFIT